MAPKSILKVLNDFEKNKKNIEGRMNVNFAFSYGGRLEIVEAVKDIFRNEKKVDIENLTENQFESFLWTSKIKDPEILIRTGGAKRLSNFLLWKSAYSELFFLEKLWPDFSVEDFEKILSDYENVKINIGK